MLSDDVLSLGLGLTPPWKLIDQHLDRDRTPNALHIELLADRGGEPTRVVEAVCDMSPAFLAALAEITAPAESVRYLV